MSDAGRRLLAALPDEPRWVETRGALADDRAELFGSGADWIVRVADQRALFIVGEPDERAARAALAGVGREWALVCATEAAAVWAERLPGWTLEEAVVHELVELPDPPPEPAVTARIERVAAASARLFDRLPDPLRGEIARVAGWRPLFAAWVEGRAVAFCYAAFETETLWDVSIDTVREYRRRGLAAACAAHTIRYMAERGKRPVWAAVESNRASLGLAVRLGFRPVDRIAVLESIGNQ